jgi:ACS family tartrate transporter-like MFS transporter
MAGRGMNTNDVTDRTIERTALTKASWRLLPLIGLGYCIAYMDRVNISFASLQMNRDLHFSAAVYGLGGGLFFLSYALFEVPSNLFLVRFGARRWIARIMVTWGVLACGMMFVRTPIQFYVMRLLLGFAEAGFFPGVLFYLTQWFPAAHRGRAISRFYIAWPLSSVFMGAFAGVLLNLQGRLGLAGWQWLFLVEGLPAILMSVVIFVLLPDRPAEAKWLSADEKAWIEKRLAADAAALGAQKDHSILRALLSPFVLQLSVINFMFLGAGYAFTLSAPALLNEATHLGVTRVGFLVAGAGLLGGVTMLLNAWHSDHSRERYFHLVIPLLVMACAYAVLSLTTLPLAVMAAYVTTVACNAAIAAVFWLIPSDVLHPRSTAVSVAAINSIGQVGSFLSPYAWGLAKDYTGSFHTGLMVLPLPFVIAAAIVLIIRQGAGTLRIASQPATVC